LRISYINRPSATNLSKPATAELTDVLQLTARKLLSCIHCSKHTKILLKNVKAAPEHVGSITVWLYINTSNTNHCLKINNYFNPFAAMDFQLCAHSSNFPLIAICWKRETAHVHNKPIPMGTMMQCTRQSTCMPAKQ